MNAAGVKGLIFVASLGIYEEVPGRFGGWSRHEIDTYLPPFCRPADVIEASALSYAILRPAWLTDKDEVDYKTTERNEPFEGTEVSRKSVADFLPHPNGGRKRWGVALLTTCPLDRAAAIYMQSESAARIDTGWHIMAGTSSVRGILV